MNWIKKLWYAQQRRIDMQILWPACIAQASDIDHARAAFALHAFSDPAWRFLGEGIYSAIDHIGE